jgi:hypothetical protein
MFHMCLQPSGRCIALHCKPLDVVGCPFIYGKPQMRMVDATQPKTSPILNIKRDIVQRAANAG